MQSTHFSVGRLRVSPYPRSEANTQGRWRQAASIVLALILVTTGSFIRERPAEEEGGMDWLVLLQLGLTVLGGGIGIHLTTVRNMGLGAKILMAYLGGVLLSAPFSPFAVQVIGYWILLAGSALVCLGLVSGSGSEGALRRVEQVIFGTIALMLLKDVLIDAFYFRTQVDRQEELGIEAYRFGMGSTSSNSMGLLAATVFWMSFGPPAGTAASVLRFFWRGLFVTTVFLTRTRIALAGLLGGAAVRWWFARRGSRVFRAHILTAGLVCLTAGVILAGTIGLLLEVDGITDIAQFVNRGEDASTVMSVTGRTDVWPYAIKRILEGPIPIAFGHGYGSSKTVLNENSRRGAFYAYHAHNTYLEAVLSTGFVGALPFLLLVGYSLTWFGRAVRLSPAFSADFTLRAVTVLFAILSATMTESELTTKVGPLTIIFLFYTLSLDRRAAFLEASQRQNSMEEPQWATKPTF